MFVSEIFAIVDAVKVIPQGSINMATDSYSLLWTNNTGISDIEITGSFQSSTNKGIRLHYGKDTNTDNTYFSGIGAGGGRSLTSYTRVGSSETNVSVPNVSLYEANSPIPIKYTKEGNTFNTYYDGVLVQSTTNSNVSTFNKLIFRSWSSSKTVSYSDIIIKPL